MDRRALIGMLAIAIGLLALIQNLNIFAVTQGLILGLLFGAVGIFCVAFYYIKSKNQAVLLIGLLGLFWGIGLLLNEFDILRADYKTIYFLFGSGLSFLAIYIHDNRKWWAVVPGGVLFVLATIQVFDMLFYLREGVYTFLFLFGIGLTFLYLYLVRDEKKQLQWAIFPAAVVILFSLFVLYADSSGNSLEVFMGLALIAIGLISIFRSRSKLNGSSSAPNQIQSAPTVPESQDNP